ncbi:hypothetical protein PRIPAC_73454 [Pristionchus pacificus]|uniref:VHL domain-containing protein n=1 Tax=Pristionchus pacificus TaxID=54126 RepID=A0A2A6C663_PRIPA|nr:hypothetical protein PRIPAC_73454 [Pristionchus pacificus]|eukprot:PDM73553.1 hypothetical protein PRIPAC_40909 [Pristionchus pacificus]
MSALALGRMMRLGGGARAALKVSARRAGHDVAPHNPGPPTTYDHMPIPCMPYAKVHSELQAKFNAMMGFGLGMLALSLACAHKVNLFSTECMRAPGSWFERKLERLMSVEEDQDLIEFNKKFKSHSDKIGLEIVPDLSSSPSLSRKRLRFLNYANGSIVLFWLNYEGRPIPYANIGPKQFIDITTYCGHPWTGRFEDTGDLCSFRLGNGQPNYDRDGHNVYVGSRPVPAFVVDRAAISIYRPRAHSLLQTAIQEVAVLINYDLRTVENLPVPESVKLKPARKTMKIYSDKSKMVALDNSVSNEKSLVEEMRKALGGPPEKLLGALASLGAWADEVIMAVIECVEKPEEGGEKKKKEVRGAIVIEHLLSDGIKRFLTEHVAQLGAEGTARIVRELQTRIEDEKREEASTRIYAHILGHVISGGANVLGYEKLRAVVKETLARSAVGLWKIGVRDASYTLARALVYILLAERDYIEGGAEREGEEWWRSQVMEKEKKLRKDAFFVTLTALVESEKELKEWAKVDLTAAEDGAITGAEGVLTARWILVDTVVCHAPTLAARCEPTVLEQLLRVAVRAHAERAELATLIGRLSSMADLPRSTWTVVISEAVACIQRILGACSESRERLAVDGLTVEIAEEERGRKHRACCGCTAPVASIVRGIAALPRTSVDEATRAFLEPVVVIVEEVLGGAALQQWAVEEGARRHFVRVKKEVKSEGEGGGSSTGRAEWPTEGVQLLRAIKAAVVRERQGETHTALTSLSRCLLLHFGATMDYAARLFADVGHVASRVLVGETSTSALAAMKPSGPAKSIDKLAKSLLKWARAVREEEERDEEKEVELLSEWSRTLLTTATAHGLSTVVLHTMVLMGRERREELLPRVWADKEAAKKMIDDCLSLLLASTAPDETFERNNEEHSTSVVGTPAASVDAHLARVVCLFLLNCTPYLARKISPADLATWERLRAMDADCARLVLERTKPDAIQSLFAALPALIDSFTPTAVTSFKPEEQTDAPSDAEGGKEKEEKEKEKDEKKGGKKGKKEGDKKDTEKTTVKRKREPASDPASTAAALALTRVARLAATAMSERAAVTADDAAAALAAASVCLATAAPAAVRPAAEAAAAAVYELATRCLEVYGEAAAHSGMLAVALAAAATRAPPSMDYERSRAELLQHARLLATAARHCKQGLLKDQVAFGMSEALMELVSLYSQLLGRLLQAAAAHAERQQWSEDDGPSSSKRRRRDQQRTLHAAAKAANAVNDEAHFAKVMPFVLADCLLPLRTAPPALQYPAVLLSQAVDRYGRSFLATCLPPAQRLAYTRMFPTFKEMNRRVV